MQVPENLKDINFDITRKKIKNIILRVVSSKDIKISLPTNAKINFLEDFIKRKEEWIIGVIKKLEEKEKNTLTYKTGANIKLIDKLYTLIVEDSLEEIIYEEGDILYLKTSHQDNENYKKQMIDYWYRKKGYEIFPPILEKYLKLTGKFVNKIKVKTLKRNWGSCQTRTKEINLNSELLKKEMKFIEYVILHEIAHLEHPNHSKNFYNYIEKFMPNYKEIKNQGKTFE